MKIEPSEIQPKAPQEARTGELGEVTRAIYKCLRMANGEPRYTTEIVLYVARALKLDVSRFNKSPVVIVQLEQPAHLNGRGLPTHVFAPGHLSHVLEHVDWRDAVHLTNDEPPHPRKVAENSRWWLTVLWSYRVPRRL